MRELETSARALRAAGDADFPADAFHAAAAHLRAVSEFVNEQAERLEQKILEAGGIAPERLRRPGGERAR
ncbi:MAG: hypothetical protein HY561_04380 [Gemmatimonadetes bacterium]|nr:hypothetical protein [Gemmatimonadota bacterium]